MRVVKVLPELIQEATASDNHNKAFLNIVRLFCEGIMDGGKVSNTFAIPDNVSRVEELGCLSVLSDMPVKALTKCHAHWLVSGKKVFMVSPEFFDVFSIVPLNGMMTDSLPTNLCGFCQLPKLVSDSQGDSFDSFYFFSGPGTQFFGSEDWRGSMTGARVVDVQQGTNILSLAWVDKQGHTNFALIPWNGAEILKDLFVGAEYKVKEGFTAQEEVFRLEDGFEDHIRLMCNLLIYLNSGTPDLRQFRNEIKYQSPTSQTPVRRDKELSSLNIELVGFGYKKSPIYSKDIFSQPAYWAHRYFGVGRTEKKYMLVKGSIKTRNRSTIEGQL